MAARPPTTTPDRWLGVVVAAPDPVAAGPLAAELVRKGARAVVERADGTLATHFPPPGDFPAFLAALAVDLERAAGRPVDLNWHWQLHEEWAETWKRGLRSVRVSRRIAVSPTWDVPPEPDGGVRIVLDPGVAFGTARHASTRCALRLLDRAVRPGASLADVGTGSGILAIAAARLGAARVLAADRDPLACAAAQDNADANRVGDAVAIHEREVSSAWLGERHPLDGVVANVESGVLVALLPGFADALAAGGWLLASGLLAEESSDFAYEAGAFGFRLRDDDAEDGWWAGTFALVSARAGT